MTIDVNSSVGMDISDFLTPGTEYTFVFSIKSVQVTNTDVLMDLQTVPGLSQLSVPFFSVLAERMDISFLWNGDGSTVVANVAGNVKQSIEGNHWLTTVDIIKAVQGGREAPAVVFAAGSPGAGLASQIGPAFSSLKTVAILVLIGLGLVVAFEGLSFAKEVA